jgi:hypothetical protein
VQEGRQKNIQMYSKTIAYLKIDRQTEQTRDFPAPFRPPSPPHPHRGLLYILISYSEKQLVQFTPPPPLTGLSASCHSPPPPRPPRPPPPPPPYKRGEEELWSINSQLARSSPPPIFPHLYRQIQQS